MEKTLVVGDGVWFVDAVAQHHAALITAIHGTFYETEEWTEEQVEELYGSWTRPEYYSDEEWMEQKTAMVGTKHSVPSINLVYVTDDESKSDPYGRQIERKTSVVHRSNQSAHGMYWYFN